MMLGYLVNAGDGALDAVLRDLVARLQGQGLEVLGALQRNMRHDPERPCDINLVLLADAAVIRISQDRGRFASGCRLDPHALADAAASVEAALDRQPPALLIINKFGKSEAEGAGFRTAMAKALMADVPVLTTVAAGQQQAFEAFADGLATQLPADLPILEAWCKQPCLPAPR